MENARRTRVLVPALALLATLSLGETLPASSSKPVAEGAGWLGVMLGRLPASPPAATKADEHPGVPVSGIIEDGPAERAGLRSRDVILAVDGITIASSAELMQRIRGIEPGRWIPLTIRRKGRDLDMRVELGERPLDIASLRPRRGWIGLQAIDLPAELQEHFGAPRGSGVMVSLIEPGSPAEAAGFELGDVVYAIDGVPMDAAEGLKQSIGTWGVGNAAEFSVVRAGTPLVLEAVIERVRPVDEPRARS